MKYCAKCNNLMLDRRPSCLRCGNESPSTVSQKLHGFTEAHPVSGDDTRREIVSGTFFSPTPQWVTKHFASEQGYGSAFFSQALRKDAMVSMGIGKMVVEFFSEAISTMVCR